jgi:hypothetical protein
MKLFYQLDHEQRHNATHYMIDIVVQNMIEDGVEIDPEDDEEEIEMKEKMREAFEHIKQFDQYEDKIEYLMSDDDINSILHQIGENMATGAYYHEDSEMVVFEGEITPEDGDEVKEDDGTVKNVISSDDKKMLN